MFNKKAKFVLFRFMRILFVISFVVPTSLINPTSIAVAQGNPTFSALPEEDRITGEDWLPDYPSIEITVDDNDPWLTNTDENGHFDLQLGEFDLYAGQFVTVTDGTNTKDHTVTALSVTNIDPGVDTISGTTGTNDWELFDVQLWVHPGDDENLHTFDTPSDGNWSGTFTNYDLQPGDGGVAAQFDDEGDNTWVKWMAPSGGGPPSCFGDNNTWSVALGDVNGDSSLDWIIGNDNFEGSDHNEVWFNDGSGYFSDSGQVLGNLGSREVKLADLDGDKYSNGKPILDIFVANQFGDPNTVWLNNVSGIFTHHQDLGNQDSVDLALGDLDGDGDIDAYVANSEGNPDEVWFNDGAGNFNYFGPGIGSSSSEGVALGYIDNDAYLDAFVANYHNEPNQVWLNNGAGVFSDSGQSLGDSDSFVVKLAYLDNDLYLDAFVGNGSHQPADGEVYPNKLYLNNGTGTFIDSGQDPGEYSTWGLDLGDLDGDGDVDAFVGNNNGPSEVWLNDGDSSGEFSLFAQVHHSAVSVALGDLDDDGDLDVVLGSHGPNAVFFNDGHGNFYESGQCQNSGPQPDPYFSVITNFQQVGGHHWPSGANLTLEIDDPETPENPDFRADTMVEEAPWDPGSETWFEFNLSDYEEFYIDLVKPGNIFTVFDVDTTKSLIIEPLFVTDIDPLTNVITGTAINGSDVRVDPNPNEDSAVFADFEGSTDVWTAQNSDWDIHPYFGGDASQWDEDGDSTQFQMRLPLIEANITNNWIYLVDFNHNINVTVDIDYLDPAKPTTTLVVPTDNEGQAWLNGWENGFNLDVRDLIVVTDGFSGLVKDLILEDLVFGDVDLDEYTVNGTAAAGTLVQVDIGNDEGQGHSIEVLSAQDGNWIADFGSEDFTITWDMGVRSRVFDEDFDATIAEPGPPFLHVVPYWPEVHGHEWDWESLVTLTIEDEVGTQVYTESKYVWDDPWCGEPCFDLSGILELQPGWVVTMTDGETTRTVIVNDLLITEVDTDSDTVSGTGQSGDIVQVDIHEIDQCVSRFAEIEYGNWIADFSSQNDTEDECLDPWDLDEYSSGRAIITKLRHWDNGTLAYWPPPIKFLGAILNPVAISEYFDLTATFKGDVTSMQYSIPNFLPWKGLPFTAVEDYGPVDGIANDKAPDSPGVYPVIAQACNTRDECLEVLVGYLAVYDPSAGFVTGGGQIVPGGKTSYNDDRLPNIDGSSPAVFGFNVKYKKGSSTVPSGHIMFQYRRGDLKLQSSEFDWLVVTNAVWGKFKGIATIDGMEGQFPFRVDAKDGDKLGGAQDDIFIIKIWEDGADPDHDDPIYRASGDVQGQIVIHTDKDPLPIEPITMVLPRFEFSSDYAEHLTAARRLGKMLEEKLNVGVDVFVPPGDYNESIDAAVEAMANGAADMSLLTWVQYLILQERNAEPEPAAGIVRFEQTFYNGQFLTNIPNITGLGDLEGRHICWAQENSMSGYIVPSLMLMRDGILSTITSEFAGNHFVVVEKLYYGGCENGAAFVDARDMLVNQGMEDAKDVIHQLPGGITPNIPNDQFIFGSSFPEELQLREQMVEALLQIANDPDGMAVLDVLQPGLHGLDVVEDSLYGEIRMLLEHSNVNMTAEFLWYNYMRD